jgi:hypothetical protein
MRTTRSRGGSRLTTAARYASSADPERHIGRFDPFRRAGAISEHAATSATRLGNHL